MLVLSRHRDETVMIGDEIELTIVDIRGDKVRLGIKAPDHVKVHRKEIYEAIRRENLAAIEVLDEGSIARVRPAAVAAVLVEEHVGPSNQRALVAGAAARRTVA